MTGSLHPDPFCMWRCCLSPRRSRTDQFPTLGPEHGLNRVCIWNRDRSARRTRDWGRAYTLSQDQGITRKFTTTSTGTYSFSLLPPATYTLKIAVSGFAPFEQDGIVLAVDQAVELNPTLAVGNASSQVVVSTEAPLLTTDTPDIGDDVSGKQMLEMPLNFRSSLALVFLDSQNRWFDQGALGNTVDTADQDYSLMAVGGQVFAGNSFLLDGSENGMMAYNGVMYVP